jgi:uncharacterized protein YbjT (DUF2867 family)
MTELLLTGATGRLGGEVAERLAARGVAARALVRPGRDPAPLRALGHRPVAGDLDDPPGLRAALRGVHTALLLTGDHPRQAALEGNLIRAAAAEGVERVVKVSAASAGLEPPVSFGREHRRAERELQERGSPAWAIVRPTLFMQSLLLFAPAVRRGRLVAPTRGGRVAMVDRRDVADVAVAALLDRRHDRAILEVTGPEAPTFAEVAALLSRATGRRVRHLSPPAPLALAGLRLAAGMPAWQAAQVVALMVALSRDAQRATTGTVADVTGRPPRTLAAFAEEHAGDFAGGAR